MTDRGVNVVSNKDLDHGLAEDPAYERSEDSMGDKIDPYDTVDLRREAQPNPIEQLDDFAENGHLQPAGKPQRGHFKELQFAVSGKIDVFHPVQTDERRDFAQEFAVGKPGEEKDVHTRP
jgi:hypothetical protein